ncbi:MAG: hypothetical protein RLZZ519_3141 [Bacteroidota bacterium]
MTYPISPSFDPINPESLAPESQKPLWDRLPQEFRDFLSRYNGGAVERYGMTFLTGIPFAEDDATLPSKPDDIEQILGFTDSEDDSFNDLHAYNFVDGLNTFPEGTITIARCHYGTLGICLDAIDFGAIYFSWTHFPSVADHYHAKRSQIAAQSYPTPELAKRAEDFADHERVADNWSDFLANLLPNEEPEPKADDVQVLCYEKAYEQIKRRSAYNNAMLMVQGKPNAEQANVLKNVSGGFLPSYWEAEIVEEVATEPSLLMVDETGADSWIMDQMLDILMLDRPIDPKKYDLLLIFARQIGYPKTEVDRSIADYFAFQERKKHRQAPPLDEMIKDGQQNAIATIQSIYLVAMASGNDLNPAQDKFFIDIAREYELDPEELMFIVRHRHGLGLVPAKFPGWNKGMQDQLVAFLKLEPEIPEGSLTKAKELYVFLGGTEADLLKRLRKG